MSTATLIPTQVFSGFLKKSEEVLRQEDDQHWRYGPAYEGTTPVDDKTAVLGYVTVLVEKLRAEHQTYKNDFIQLWSCIGLAQEPDAEVVRELDREARHAYSAAETRLKLHAQALRAISEKFGGPKQGRGLEDEVTFPWEDIESIQERARQANEEAAQEAARAEAELESGKETREDGQGAGERSDSPCPDKAELEGASSD